MEEFNSQEREILSRFVTNVDRPIFAIFNLPESVKGALFSRYSRSNKSLRRLLLDEFILNQDAGIDNRPSAPAQTNTPSAVATQKADEFYQRVLDGYGDDSVGELGGAHIACEQVSNIAAKVLEDPRLGGSPLEKSTRYVFFDQKDENNEYLFYREPTIVGSEFEKEYVDVNNLLFDTYAQFIPAITEHIKGFFPLESFVFKDPSSGVSTKFADLKDEKIVKRAEAAFKTAVRSKACDVVRYILPACTKTNVGIYGNGRFFQNLLNKMYSDQLQEIRTLAGSMHHELDSVIRPFVKRSKFDEYISQTHSDMFMLSKHMFPENPRTDSNSVTLVDYDPLAEEKIIAYMVYPYAHHSLSELRSKISRLSSVEKEKIISAYLAGRRNRRDKPFRGLEQTYYEFDTLADFGAYRDLQRHRVLTQMRQDLTILHGYETPEEILEAGLKREYDYAMRAAAELYQKIHARFPREAQYVIPFAYRVRWTMKMNLREAFHLVELRSGIQGHPSYRRIAQLLYQEINHVHPSFAKHMKFVDLSPSQTSLHLTQKPISSLYALSRFQAEMKNEEKREKWAESKPVNKNEEKK